jgi:hypothetical protein
MVLDRKGVNHMKGRIGSLADNSVLQSIASEVKLFEKRSAAAKKGVETKREKARVEALKPRVRNLFQPAPVFRNSRLS